MCILGIFSILVLCWYIYLYSISQAYHNELVTKVSRLEEENLKLKKEKASNTYLHLSSVRLFL